MTRWIGLRTVGAAGVAVLALSSCVTPGSPQSHQPPGVLAPPSRYADPVRQVGPDEFAAVIAEPGRVAINVHVPYEGDIPGTDLSVPFDQIGRQADRLPADRSTPLAIYCRSGSMSETAGAELTGLGYTDVVELKGGMRAWQQSGRSVTTGDN